MSLPLEQGRAIAQARHFLSELCVPGKIKRVPREVRLEARRRLKHMPMSWDLERIVAEPGVIEHMQETEDYYRKEFWGDIKPYPEWICDECGRLHGRRPEGNPYGATWHIDECGVCGTGGVEVTECRDFGHLKEGWDNARKAINL